MSVIQFHKNTANFLQLLDLAMPKKKKCVLLLSVFPFSSLCKCISGLEITVRGGKRLYTVSVRVVSVWRGLVAVPRGEFRDAGGGQN